MKEKIINTKNILKIILLVLIIFSAFKSCAKAYTFDEFVEFLTYCKNNSINSSISGTNTARNEVINRQNGIKQILIDNNYNINNYNAFLVQGWSSGTTYRDCFMFNNVTKYSVESSGNINIQTSTSGIRIRWSSATGSMSISSYTNINSITKPFALIEILPTTGEINNALMQNKWCYINLLPRDNLAISNLPWYIADIFIGQGNSNLTKGLYDEQGQIIGEYEQITSNITAGTLTQFKIANQNELINGNYYTIKIKNGETTLTETGEFKLQWYNDWNSGNSGDTSPSGDGRKLHVWAIFN